MRVLRNLFLLALSAVLSYLFLLHEPGAPVVPVAASEPAPDPVLDVAPRVRTPPGREPEPAPVALPPPMAQPEPAAEPPAAALPPPEQGAPEGDEESEKRTLAAEDEHEAEGPAPNAEAVEAERVRQEVTNLTRSAEFLRRAEDELGGRTRRGFQTEIKSVPRNTIAVANFFGESLILIPKDGLNPTRPRYYRLDPGPPAKVVEVRARPPSFRQYRNLLAWSYEQLPSSLRLLRRTVPRRGDIYVFGATIPPSEWAVVIARRDAALAQANRTTDDLRHVTMDYVPLHGGGFDIRVERFLFQDGTSWTPKDES